MSQCGSQEKDKSDDKEGVVIGGIRWATSNVDMPGTFAATPEDAGMFYQWNRKVGWSSTDPMINSDGITKWDDSYPSGDTWEQENDPCPCGWRVPTMEELIRLEKSNSYWDELNGVGGRFFGEKDNILFLPAGGGRNLTTGLINLVGEYGFYWGSSEKNNTASRLVFTSALVGTNYSRKPFGYTVRCVAIE